MGTSFFYLHIYEYHQTKQFLKKLLISQSSIFDGSAWTWNEKRKQFYFHQFLPEQPDFDLRNENLKKELKVSTL